MGASDPKCRLNKIPTKVPVDGDRQLKVSSGMPWPSAYRGSKYSVVESRNHGHVLKWSYRGLIQAMTHLPEGLKDSLDEVGKTMSRGSVRITSQGEVLTKVAAASYEETDEAHVDNGYIPVYLGKIDANPPWEVENYPEPSPDKGDISVWTGFPFKHGETWSVCYDDVVRWKWQDYEFESAFDHPELVEYYKQIRPRGGRIYINEAGHIWGNLNREDVPRSESQRVTEAIKDWKRNASDAGKRLVKMRLDETESRAADDGLLPVYLGHLSQFDDGLVPKPVVDDKRYFIDTSAENE
jgi:hypothetical protein